MCVRFSFPAPQEAEGNRGGKDRGGPSVVAPQTRARVRPFPPPEPAYKKTHRLFTSS